MVAWGGRAGARRARLASLFCRAVYNWGLRLLACVGLRARLEPSFWFYLTRVHLLSLSAPAGRRRVARSDPRGGGGAR